MSNHDEALVEKAAQVLRGLERARGHMPDATGIDSRDAAEAVLDAVADDLRADGWDRGYDAASTCHCAAYNEDECGCGYYGNEPVYRDENPYRRERA